MKKSNCLKVILTLTVVLLLVFGANNTVLGYGDGGGGGGGAVMAVEVRPLQVDRHQSKLRN